MMELHAELRVIMDLMLLLPIPSTLLLEPLMLLCLLQLLLVVIGSGWGLGCLHA